MSDDIAIKVEHVGKKFKLPHDKATSLKSNLINIIRRKRGYELQEALEDISFEVKKGEFYGIVGKNGGGKSTLLKIISGIYVPTKGAVHIDGKLTPFIELGVGFNPELTGRENVFLNGALLGFNRKEMEKMYADIVSFAELGRFMDQKLKNYSSGMQVRLAFSIAIRAQSEILVMDEVLAVGDAAFQKKCFDIFRELKKQGRTIVLVTHDMGNVERFCDRVLVLNEGKQLGVMTPAEASLTYARLNIDEDQVKDKGSKSGGRMRYGNGDARVEKATLTRSGKPTEVFKVDDELVLDLKLSLKQPAKNKEILIGLAIHNEDGQVVAGPNTQQQPIKSGSTSIKYTIDRLRFAPGEYTLTIVLYYKDDETVLDSLDRWLSFSVISDHMVAGMIELDGQWAAEK